MAFAKKTRCTKAAGVFAKMNLHRAIGVCGLTIGTLCLTLSALHAQETTPGQPTTTETPVVVTGKKEKKVCKTVVSTGSIMPKRVCQTVSEIAAQAEKAQQAIQAGQQAQETAEQTRLLREGK